jgi:chaperone required for assembly of F1-ATPase
MKALTIVSAAAMAVCLGAAGATAANAAADATAKSRSCFSTTQWQGWNSPSSDTLYLKMNNRDVFRVGLVGKADGRSLKTPGSRLVTKSHGSSFICSALDLDVALADTTGFSHPLFPQTLTKMTPEEVAAIPKKFRP